MNDTLNFLSAFLITISFLAMALLASIKIGRMCAKKEIDRYKKALDESLKREEIAKQVIKDKRKK